MGTSRNEARSKARKPKTRRVDLTSEEAEVALAACRQYRHSIPSYLASRRDELLRIDAVIRKLS